MEEVSQRSRREGKRKNEERGEKERRDRGQEKGRNRASGEDRKRDRPFGTYPTQLSQQECKIQPEKLSYYSTTRTRILWHGTPA